MKTPVLFLLLSTSLLIAQASKPSVYIEPQQGFETYIAAAIAKKGVPVDVVTNKAKAVYVLRSAPVEVKSESTGGKIARCLFAYCAGIEDKGNVSVQLIEVGSTKMVWAYSVNKQRGGSKNQQSMAEAVAKHFKEFLAGAPAVVQADVPDESATPDQSSEPAQAPAPAAATTAPTPAATSAAYQPQDNVQDQPATQSASVALSGGDSLGDAARKAKQHKACLDLAKSNPSIVCK